MVSYQDGSVLAQLGNPDMRTPIAFGLAYPDRIDSGVAPLDLTKVMQLNFQAPDFNRFPCLSLAYAALNTGKSAPTILNASTEVAVQAFLDGRIGFRMIDQILARVMDRSSVSDVADMGAILECDDAARALRDRLLPY
mgnify:CR=1 FL=1